MDLEILILSEGRYRKTNTIGDHLYLELKTWHKRTRLQNRNQLTDMEHGLVVSKWEGMGWGELVWGQ